VTIEGPATPSDTSGLIFSAYDGSTPSIGLARGFYVQSTCDHVTIRNFKMKDLQKMVDVVDNPTNLDFVNLHGEDMVSDGIFLTGEDSVSSEEKASHVLLQDCSTLTTHIGHGFRGNANDVTVKNCSAYDVHSTGLWVQGGNRTGTDDSLIDGFASNKRVIIGPNSAASPGGSQYEFLSRIKAQRVRVGGAEDNFIVEMGTCRACIVNVCAAKLEVGKATVSVAFNKPLNNVNWDSLDWTSAPGGSCTASFN
jgi:hypothetical protein